MIRTTKQALAEATRRWGKDGAVRDNGIRFADGTPRPTAEERQALEAELVAHRAAKPEPPKLATFGDERTVGEYRAAVRTVNEWKERDQHLCSLIRARRYTVGRATWAFIIEGEGDTWDEAFAEVDRRRVARAS